MKGAEKTDLLNDLILRYWELRVENSPHRFPYWRFDDGVLRDAELFSLVWNFLALCFL